MTVIQLLTISFKEYIFLIKIFKIKLKKNYKKETNNTQHKYLQNILTNDKKYSE